MKKFWHGLFLVLIVFALAAAPVQAQIDVIPTTAVAPGTETWQFDTKVTEVGKRAERARQFIGWVLSHDSIDNHRVFMDVWKVSLGVTLTLTTLVIALLGLGLVLARKQDISVKVDVVPILVQAALIILYAVFSYFIVLGIIQITNVIMSFFIKFLGGDKLFSIFFSADPTGDQGYINFVGQRNLDPLVNESAKTSLFLIDVSSYTYFIMGIMILIRKVILWFLLILSPFLALLMPFRFIRNVGWIWIGVFFQWAFYGPLFAIFLWTLNKIWEAGIPFAFDFSRIVGDNGVVYPLAINILYGGPQQVAGGLGQPLSHQPPINSASYVDTFAEYVISLVMLWVVMVFPWWLLRIFRDYCCEGIYAIKNILMNMMGNRPPAGGSPPNLSSSLSQQIGQALRMNQQAYQRQEMRQQSVIEKHENIKTVKTEEISRRMDVSVSRLSDIARIETQTDKKQHASASMQYLRNPMSAEHKEQQSEFTKLKTELSTRAATGDIAAKRLMDATTSTGMMVRDRIAILAHQQARIAPLVQRIAVEVNLPEDRVKQIAVTFVQAFTKEQQILQKVSQSAAVQPDKTKQVIEAVPDAVSESDQKQALEKIAKKTGLDKAKTKQVLEEAEKEATNPEVAQEVAAKEQVSAAQVTAVGQKMFNTMNTEAPVFGPKPKVEVSIEEYEEMRRMWVEHYTKGEIPVTDKIKNREAWVAEERVRLENVLNKISAANEEVRAQGLTEVADIIPFFILGDMSIQDIAVYLKAKLTAAKDVAEILSKEASLKARLEEATTQYVEVDRNKPTAKTQELKQELKL